MMVMAIWMLGWLLGLSRRQCAGAAMFAATAYAILAEPSPPIFRAAIMTDLGCLSLLTGRPTRVANWLAMSALVILVVRPTQLFNAGFQLSYVTLLSVIYVAPALHDAAAVTWRRLRRRDDPLLSPEIQKRIGMTPKWPRLRRCLRGLGWYMAIGLAAWTVGGLLSAYHFHQLQMWGWLNTMLLVPLVWIVMVLGLVKTLVTPFVPWLAGGLGWPLAVCTQALIGFVQILSSMPGSGLPTPALPTGVVCLSLLVVLVWVVRVPLRLNIHAVRFAVLCSMIAIAWSAAPRQPGKELRVVVLAVGSGSSIVLELPNGKTLLYDVGSFPPYDLERWTIGPLLARDHCPRIDAVILSHANLDHYGGLGNLLARRSVGSIISTPHFEHAAQDHHASRELVKTIQDKRIPWRRTSAGARLSGTGDVLMEVLWPPPGELQPADSNDTSLVLRVSHEGVRILLCGDIEEYAISQLIAGVDVQADILLLPHHGSVVPSTAAFIRAVNPKCCIRSTGRKETSEELRKSIGDRDYLSTAQGGAVSIGVAEGNISIERP
jgi:competence protein ComEC